MQTWIARMFSVGALGLPQKTLGESNSLNETRSPYGICKGNLTSF